MRDERMRVYLVRIDGCDDVVEAHTAREAIGVALTHARLYDGADDDLDIEQVTEISSSGVVRAEAPATEEPKP